MVRMKHNRAHQQRRTNASSGSDCSQRETHLCPGSTKRNGVTKGIKKHKLCAKAKQEAKSFISLQNTQKDKINKSQSHHVTQTKETLDRSCEQTKTNKLHSIEC